MGPRSKCFEFVSLLFPVQTVYLGKFCFTSYSKEGISIFDFLHGDIQQEEVAESETTAFHWVCPGILSHAEICQDLLLMPLVVLGIWPDQN